jgi:hypothetical protein
MLIAVLITITGVASAQTIPQIGLKFGITNAQGLQTNAAGALQPTDQAGVFPQTNWNVLGKFGDNTGASSTNTTAFSVKDSSGSNTAIVVNWDATGNWSVSGGGGTPTPQGTPDGNLMNAFLDTGGNANTVLTPTVFSNNGSNKPLVYISGLSNWLAANGVTYYDVVLYANGDAAAGRTGEYWLMNASGPTTGLTYNGDLTTHQFICDRFKFTSDLTYRQSPSTVTNGFVAQYGNFDGDYTVFQSLTNDSFLVRTEEFRNGGTLRSPINAIQIVPRATPLPAILDPVFPSTVFAGGKAVFRATVAGQTPFTFRWQKNGANMSDGGNISGSSTSTLVISNVSNTDQAPYNVIVSNAIGSVTSSVATLTVTTPTPGSYAEKVFTNNPVAYWRLNEGGDPSTNYTSASDYVGGFTGAYQFRAQNGFNGVVGPQPSAGYPGFESGNTALQTGTTAAGNLAHSWVTGPPLQLKTNFATFVAWIYPTAANEPGSAGIIWSRNGGDTGGLDYQNANHLGYTWNGQGGTFNFGTGPIVPSNIWSLVAAVITPSNATLYCYNTNGQFSATNVFTNAPQAFNGLTQIGDDPSSLTTPQNRAFIGLIDEAAVFNYALSGTQINDFYKKGLGLTAILPVVSIQPVSEALYPGRTATFSVLASGDPILTYQWRTNGVNMTAAVNVSGINTPNLVVSNVTAANAANYDVVVANLAGSTTSSVANLAIVSPPAVLSPYEAKLQALNPVDYWRFNETNGSPVAYDYWGGDIATNNNVTAGQAGPEPPAFSGFESTNAAYGYDGLDSGTVTGLVGAQNNLAQFTLLGWFNTPGVEPVRTGLFGQNDTLEYGFHAVDASGQAQFGIFTGAGGSVFMAQSNITVGQWYMSAAVGNGTNVSVFLFTTNGGGGFQVAQAIGGTPTTNYGSSAFGFNIGGDGVLDPTGNFFTGSIDEVAIFHRALSVGELSDLFGSAIGLTSLAPQITVQPAPAAVTVYSGRTLNYNVTAVGSATLAYQWRTNGIALTDGGSISGSSTSSLTVSNVSATYAGLNYDVVVANSAGSVTSSVVTFSVITLVPGTYAAAVVGLNPLAYYRLNETNDPSVGGVVANDFAGGHSGVYAGAGVSNAFSGILGPVPPGFAFETNNGAIAVSAIPASWVTAPFGSLSANNVTMCMWINPQGTFDQFAGLLMNRNSGVAGGFGFAGGGPAGQLGYTWNNNNANTYGFNSGIFPPTNQWSFVALVVQPNSGTLYMVSSNGVKSGVNAIAHTADVFGNNWQIGRDNSANADNGTRNFNGFIDEVAVFNRALTLSQLLSMYSAAGTLPPLVMQIQTSGTNEVITWPYGTLQQSTSVSGPWTNNPAASPYIVAPVGTLFYRVKVQ